MSTPAVLDPEERIVEEAQCWECRVPITAIPSWYANVAVRFTCDSCRQKASKSVTIPNAPAEAESPRTIAAAILDPETDAEPAIDEIDIDDVELEEADTEADVVEE